MKLTADDVVLTAGSGEAIAMVIQALTDPGDVCLTEEYVYLKGYTGAQAELNHNLEQVIYAAEAFEDGLKAQEGFEQHPVKVRHVVELVA